MARNRRRMHHRASRIKIFTGPLSGPGPHAVRASRFALALVPQPQHQPLFFKVGEH